MRAIAASTFLVLGAGCGSADTLSPLPINPVCVVENAENADAGPMEDDGTWTGGPTDVPISILITPDDELRFTVNIKVGDAPPFDALLDTGSAGLRILPGRLPDNAFESITTTPSTEQFHSGVEVDGVVALARVTFGDRTTAHPIPIERIEKVSCTRSSSYCETEANARDAFDGFGAILGVGMRSSRCSTIGNPIIQLPGHPSFVVKAPAFGGDRGILRIGPSRDETARFATLDLALDETRRHLPDGTPSFSDDQVPVCLRDSDRGRTFCSGGLFDTGNPAMQVQWASEDDLDTVPSGASITVAIGPKNKPITSYAFDVGMFPLAGHNLVVIEPADGEPNLINLGTAIFFRRDVWIDQPHGRIGLAPHGN